jgi:tRNA 2-selenouridine synthase SelU
MIGTAMMKYMTKTREYAEVAKRQIDQVATEIERLQGKADQAIADLRAEYEHRIREISGEYDKELRNLRQMRYDAEARVTMLMNASGSAVDDVRSGVDAAINEMNDALARARKHFKDL